MQFTPIWFITLGLYIATVLVVVFLAKFTTKPIDSEAFSFKRVFPFEVLNRNIKPTLYRAFLCAFVGVSFIPVFNLFTSYGQIANIEYLSIIICCVFGLASICFAFLHYFDATHTMVHLVLFVLFVALTLLGNTFAAIKGYAVYKVYAQHGQNMVCSLIGAVICSVCALVCVIISINPKLKNWAVLEKTNQEYMRPKVFVLALSEWMTFLMLVVGEISYFLILLVQ